MSTTTWTIEARNNGAWDRGTAGSGPENRFATEDDALDAIASLAEAHGADESDYRVVRIVATEAEIESVAGELWSPARELAHSRVAPCDGETYATAYVEAVAECCGVVSASQCATGEAWDPAAWLAGDAKFVEEHASKLGVELDGRLWRRLWRLYQEPSDEARRSVEMHD